MKVIITLTLSDLPEGFPAHSVNTAIVQPQVGVVKAATRELLIRHLDELIAKINHTLENPPQ